LRYSIELTCMTLYIGCHTVVPSWYLNHNYSPRTYYPATSNKPSTWVLPVNWTCGDTSV
jgi:hypothetical protein